jgi:hypothetical protein
MIVGFAGPREGLLSVQHESLRRIAAKLSLSVFVHGGSYGSDTLAHYAFRSAHPTIPIIVMPATKDNGSIVTAPYGDLNIILQPRGPLERNDMIVTVITGLVAAPKMMTEELRGGTWYTIRRARKKGVPILFVWPDGTTSIERNDSL